MEKNENSAGREQLNERGEIVVAAIGGATHARGRVVKAVLGVFGPLGSITASAGPKSTTPEPFLAILEISAGQEHLIELGETVVAAIGGATHAH